MPPQVSLAARTAAKPVPMVAQTAPAPNLAPLALSTKNAAAPPSPGANVLLSITPTLPVYLNITLDRAVMTVDETAVVTVSLYSTAALAKKQLKLVLDVPNDLVTTTGGKGKLQWNVPDLSAGQIFQQQITVRVDKAKKALKQGVVRFTATSNAVGHKALMTEKLLGIVPATSVTDGTQSADGTVLRDVERGITLLTPPGATNLGVALHYKPRFRAPRQKAVKLATPPVQGATTPLPTTQALTDTANNTATLSGLPFANQPLTNTLYLPLVDQANLSAGVTASPAEASLTASAAPTTSVGITTLVPITDNGVNVYEMWQFDAIQATQPITQFNEPLLLLISADWLVQAGIDPAQMDLWTREQDTDDWQLQPVEYDPVHQQYSAWLTHFSTYTIGDGLSTRGEVLPTTEGFNSDRLTGVATVHYAIETPKGLGGLSPNLSVDYSSSVVDDFLFDAGDDDYDNQASWVGYGWNVSGLSYIDRAEVGTPSNTSGFYTMVLNGSRSNINGGRSGGAFLDSDYFTKIKSVQNATFDGWEVTGTDGTLYRFGGPDLAEAWPTGQRGMNTPISKYLYTSKKHIFDKWYLSEVRDPLGNRMTFTYEAQRGDIQNWKNCNTGYTDNNQEDNVWYTRSVLPKEIDWSYTDPNGADGTQTMRVIFEYSGDRFDYKVPGFETDCRQPYYTLKRLLDIKVQVKDKDTKEWDTLHLYTFTYLEGVNSAGQDNPAYPCSGSGTACKRPGGEERHMLLQKIDHYGKNGAGDPITAYTFTYYADNTSIPGRYADVTTNNLRLQTADNSLGGKVQFTYTAKNLDPTQCPTTVCTATNQGDERRWRFPVTRTTINDGMGNQIVTDYAYQNPAMRGEYNQYGTLAASEFLGFKDSTARHFEIVAEGTTPNQEAQYEEMSFWQAAPSSASAPKPRDPRTGKMQSHKIWSNPLTNGAQCPTWETPSDDQQRCLLAKSTPVWVAYRLTNNVWTTWVNEQTGPFWVRKETDNEIKDGASNSTTYLYDLAQQNGGQFGNVTQVQESADGELLRTTVTEYFPNAAANIVNKPARVRVYQGAFSATAPLNNCLAETRTIYDNMEIDYNSPPSKGLVAKTQQAITACASATTIGMYDANWQETRMAYDSHGNQTNLHHVGASATEGNDWLHTAYDDYYQLFPIRQEKGQNPAFAETAAYYGVNGNGPNDAPYGTNSASASDPKAYWGAMAEHCAVNEVCTRQAYDNFGRPTLRWDNVPRGNAWDTDANASVLWTYRNPKMNAGFKTTVVTEAHAPRCEGNFVRKHYNGLGQLVAEQKPDQDWTWTADDCTRPIQLHEIETLYAYNALGQQTRASVPYRATENWVSRIAAVKWNTVWNSTPNTAIAYDPLGRPTRSIAPNDEFTRYDYLRRSSTSKTKERTKSDNDPDAYRANWWKELDGLGNVANIRTWTYIGQDPNRPPRDPWVETTRVNFTYDATGNLTKVEHPIGLGIGTTTMTYDLLGHKLSMNDVDMGSWSYAYDRQGKLTRQTDARNQTTCLYYENVLERVSGKFFTTGPSCSASATSYDITYQYDQNQSSTNRSRGQLTYVTKNGWNKQLYYQAQGLLAEELVNIQGAPQSYATYYGYDAYWRPNTIIYPNGETVTTSYNGMGLPTRLNSSWWGTTPMIDQASYDELGRPTAMYLPDAHHWRSYTYWPWTGPDGNSNRRLQYIAYGDANDSASKLVVGNYYDSFGNITVSDRDFSRSAFDHGAFTYDAQNRLTNGYGLNYAYDNAGRLTAYEGNGLTAYPGHPHAMVKGVSNYTFDANGNMTKRAGGQILTWDAENHLSSVSGNGSTESYWYDADGQRVKKTVNGVTTFYPNQYVEQTGTQITQYHYFNGQRVSLHTNAPGDWIHYDLHVDQLGSTVLTTYQGGSPLTRQNYYAYGNYRPGDNGLQTDHRFTGQQQDTSGLVYMNARYYDPQLGQFISPDTLVPDATNVFDYNRYMYARGNPMKYNDPTGHCIAQGQDGWDSTANTQCYADAYNIANLGGLDYIQKYFGGGYKSVDQWLKTALSDPNLDGNFLHPHAGPLYQNWCSSVGLIGQAGCSGTYTPNPVPPQPYLHCDRNCLISLGIDTIGVGASLAVVSGSTLCGPGAPVCVTILTQGGTAVGILSTLGGVIWTGYLNQQHQVTDADINVTMAVAGANLLPPLGATRPVVGLVANLVQLTWDIPKHPSLNKPELSEQTHDP